MCYICKLYSHPNQRKLTKLLKKYIWFSSKFAFSSHKFIFAFSFCLFIYKQTWILQKVRGPIQNDLHYLKKLALYGIVFSQLSYLSIPTNQLLSVYTCSIHVSWLGMVDLWMNQTWKREKQILKHDARQTEWNFVLSRCSDLVLRRCVNVLLEPRLGVRGRWQVPSGVI